MQCILWSGQLNISWLSAAGNNHNPKMRSSSFPCTIHASNNLGKSCVYIRLHTYSSVIIIVCMLRLILTLQEEVRIKIVIIYQCIASSAHINSPLKVMWTAALYIPHSYSVWQLIYLCRKYGRYGDYTMVSAWLIEVIFQLTAEFQVQYANAEMSKDIPSAEHPQLGKVEVILIAI